MQKKSTYSIKKQKLLSQTNNDLRVYMRPVEEIQQVFLCVEKVVYTELFLKCENSLRDSLKKV